MTIARREGQFVGEGPSAPIQLLGRFNLTIAGSFTGAAVLERSFDAGATWHAVSRDSSGAVTELTRPVSLSAEEWERGVLYRLHCGRLSGGSMTYRISQ